MITGKNVDRRKFPRIQTNGTLVGRLRFGDTPITVRTLDVSKMGLGVETNVDFDLGTLLILETPGLTAEMQVMSRFGTGATLRYGLMIMTPGVDLEAVFRAAGGVAAAPQPEASAAPRNNGPGGRTAPRFVPDQTLRVEVKTFGSREPYRLIVENLSRTGLLIVTAAAEQVPFRVNTLLDLVIDPEKVAFKSPVVATAKVVRIALDAVAGEKGKLTRLGIAIIDLTAQQSSLWDAAFDQLESPLKS